MKLSLGNTSEKRTVLVSINKLVVTAPTEGELLLIYPPPTVPPTENINCAFAVTENPERTIRQVNNLICKKKYFN